MSRPFPYTYISCPCTDTSTPVCLSKRRGVDEVTRNLAKTPLGAGDDAEEEEERTFDPRSPRSNYSLYPLEHLLYCEDCHQIRCPRCVLDEIVCWFCPNCLFEVSSTMVKMEGNSWNTSDIGILFDRPSNITHQLERVANGGVPGFAEERAQARKKVIAGEDIPEGFAWDVDLTPDERFGKLKHFYLTQLVNSSSSSNSLDLSNSYGYGSPGALSRIMGLYSGITGYGNKKSKARSMPMREASTVADGLKLLERDESVIEKMKQAKWDDTTSLSQRAEQRYPHRFLSHILVKPESKVQTTRFRIRLVALNYIPTMNLRQLQPILKDYNALPPLKPIQFLLTLHNPLFDPIRITLATPSHTPGRFASKVTILCPEFEIGANTDVWDEALSTGSKEKRRTKAESSEGQAEAGKIWEKGRNWTTVVLEVVPASLDPTPKLPSLPEETEQESTTEDTVLEEDDDVLEIPLFVHAEYETEAAADGSGGVAGAEKEKEKRELAYWCVLGVGRIAHSAS
ncbi:hypothetical protein FGG08_004170 [Glutinoglossum americanum]|uniref:Dynactin subunit 4 n=1 Tax=Glutinoglossum americanum TaxID=1670608 RepID=A0A9P8I674_9PEZI|nr:hypothetical protein FGG08_004170 [Glutinoglossum americanum]